jgi:peptidoglycan/xylan/chitin deacetylase (PgdA/CDA1 family)
MSLSGRPAPARRDVNSEDYFCAGRNLSHCPKPSLEESVLRQIEQRERKGVYTHILVFHELPSSVTSLDRLIPELQRRDYRFVRLDEYEKAIGLQPSR